jgi:energy-converting hydrogenase Eha subunit H
VSTAVNGYNLDRGVLLVAGLVTLASLTLAVAVSDWWLLLTAFVGLNLLQASVTGFCPAAIVLKRCGVRAGCAFR